MSALFITAVPDEVERLRNTPSGNPQWRIVLGHTTTQTKPDASIAGTITPDLVDKRLTVEIDTYGDLVDYLVHCGECEMPILRDQPTQHDC